MSSSHMKEEVNFLFIHRDHKLNEHLWNESDYLKYLLHQREFNFLLTLFKISNFRIVLFLDIACLSM